MLLYLVRHGQSVWNAEERHQGWQDVPLSPLGEQQAECIGQRLKEVNFDYHFSSPIFRCYQTASIIVQAKGLEPQTSLQVLEGLREARLSARMEGMLTKEMIKTWSEEEKRRFRDDYTFKFEDGEAVKTVMERTQTVFEEIASLSEDPPPDPVAQENASAQNRDRSGVALEQPKIVQKTALIVAHQINVQFFILQALGATETVVRRQTNIDRLAVANCSLSIIEVNLKGKEPFYRLHTSSDSSHLAGLKPPPKPAE